MTRENYSKCPRCKGKSIFHIGDKVTFGGNKTHHSHSELQDLADDKGLFFSGTQKKVRAIILNPNGANKRHYLQARSMAQLVMTPDEFKSCVKKVCSGNLTLDEAKPGLSSLLVRGARIYPLGLTSHQTKQINSYLREFGAVLSNRRTKALIAVIANKNALTEGRLLFFKYLGVPVYRFDRLKIRPKT